MLFAEKESNLIEMFQSVDTTSVLLLPEDTCENVFQSVWDKKRWEKWIDSSRKSDPPPDFYNNQECFMMEVMRVDDHGHKNRGKVINPLYEREHMLERELVNSGLLKLLPDDVRIFINANTGLPTEQDHSYAFYAENFQRTIRHHKERIEQYRKNHPAYKLIFFVFDESSEYTQCEKVPEVKRVGMPIYGKSHHWYFDKAFVDEFINDRIDYLIWYSPFKKSESKEKIILPRVCVYDCHRIKQKLISYDPVKMVSLEM